MQALAAYDAFAAASDAVAPFYISARRNDFAALASAAHGISDRLVTLGRASKPWFLASRARKDAYQTLLNNATEAQTQIAQLDALQSRASAANSLKKLNAAMKAAAAIKAKLDSLLENSNAAYSIDNQ
jgi:methionyl-tRNA synthetase